MQMSYSEFSDWMITRGTDMLMPTRVAQLVACGLDEA